MNKKVIFKIDKKLDFKNHLIGAERISKNLREASPWVIKYFKTLKNAGTKEKSKIFQNKSFKFYGKNAKNIRTLLVKQTQEMWDLVEKKYFNRMEKIHKNKFPFKKITGILSTTPMIYGYDFNKKNPWFACTSNSSVKAIHTTMHELMHTFFHKYFWEEYKNKFKLNNEQIWDIKEALTVLLDLELGDIRIFLDKGKTGHKILREKIKKDWLKYKDINKVLDRACLFIKTKTKKINYK